MTKTKDLGRISGSIITATNSDNLDYTEYDSQGHNALRLLITSTQALTLTVTMGRAADAIGSLPHTLTQAVAANVTCLPVIPMIAGCGKGRIYLSNASGSTATYTLDAGFGEVS